MGLDVYALGTVIKRGGSANLGIIAARVTVAETENALRTVRNCANPADIITIAALG